MHSMCQELWKWLVPAAPGTLKVQPIEGELTDAELKQMTNEQLKELIERGQDRR